MYSLGIYIYALMVRLAALCGHRKAKAMVQGHKESWKKLRTAIDKDSQYIWVHAASLGEFEQGRPLIERIRHAQPEQKIVLTFFSPSGYEVRKDYPLVDLVCYLPFDTPWNARRFVKRLRPSMLILVKYEFWCNYIHAMQRRGLPVYSVSSIFREKQVYFRSYGAVFRRCLKRVTHFFVQNEASQRLLSTIEVRGNVIVVGDTRFDRVVDIQSAAQSLPLVEKFVDGRNCIVAGSTWPEDEDLLFGYLNKNAEVRAIIAPHVVSEDHLQAIVRKCKGSVVRYSQLTADNTTANILLIDNFGLLSSLYRYATVAYVGGGFGAGIHNVPEAAVYGVPVLIGPKHQKFVEATTLVAKGGCFVVKKQKDFNATLERLLSDEQYRQAAGQVCYDYIHQQAGASDNIYAAIFPTPIEEANKAEETIAKQASIARQEDTAQEETMPSIGESECHLSPEAAPTETTP